MFYGWKIKQNHWRAEWMGLGYKIFLHSDDGDCYIYSGTVRCAKKISMKKLDELIIDMLFD